MNNQHVIAATHSKTRRRSALRAARELTHEARTGDQLPTPDAGEADDRTPDWHRGEREAPVNWLLRAGIQYGVIVATVGEWSKAGQLSPAVLLAAIDAGALDVLDGVPRRATRAAKVTSEALLTFLSYELMYASRLECPPTWRQTLPTSVEVRSRKGGSCATRTRPAPVDFEGERAA